MKKWLVFLLFVVLGMPTKGQIVARMFYNEDWMLTHKDSSQYFRVVVLDTANQIFVGPVKDFTKQGRLIMSSSYAEGKLHGEFISYYPSGKKKTEGRYDVGRRVGQWMTYHENGMMNWSAHFEDESTKIAELRDSLGGAQLLNGTGTWTETYREPITGLLIVVRGQFKDYEMDGTWVHELPDRSIWAQEEFERGNFIKGYVIADSMRIELLAPCTQPPLDDLKHRITARFTRVQGIGSGEYPYIKLFRNSNSHTNDVFGHVTISPGPVGGLRAFYQEVATQIRYPAVARRMGIEGRILVEMRVDRDGHLTDIHIKKGIGSGLDEEAIRVVKESEKKIKWKPGVIGRKRVKSQFTLPIIFKLG